MNDAHGPANGRYDVTFTLFNTDTAGVASAGPVTDSATSVSNGLFVVTLDLGNGVFDGTERWLEIGVRTNVTGDFSTLLPRQSVLPTPYAIYANTASNVVAGSVVTSLNGLKDDVTLAAGANVTITPSGNSLTIDSAGVGGSGVWSVLDNNAYYDAGNVGIGTAGPLTSLEVNGIVRSTRSGEAAQYLQLDGGDPVSIRMTAQSVASAEKSLVLRNLSGEAHPA